VGGEPGDGGGRGPAPRGATVREALRRALRVPVDQDRSADVLDRGGDRAAGAERGAGRDGRPQWKGKEEGVAGTVPREGTVTA
jgi:hypothetical protein